MSQPPRILIVEDDPTFRTLLVDILDGQGYEIVAREDGKTALMLLQRQSFDLVLSDLRLPRMGGLELYRQAADKGIAPPFVLLTAFGTIEEAVSAIKEGVSDFLTKPLKDPETLRVVVRRVLEEHRDKRVLSAFRQQEQAGLPPDEILFAGKAMEPTRKLLLEVAPTQSTVLITGESGTGKELAARLIHRLSNRAAGPFVALNCAAIPDALLESELFGHERGAFTGASQARCGKFELAAGGTLFLDEVAELPLALQAKLLRVLQERVFERVGGEREIKADIRVVVATNRHLPDEVRERRFREDLYYRLHVFPIELPPLRERRDGLPRLAEYLVHKAASASGLSDKQIDPKAMEQLVRYAWPGNIRELQNVLERAVILSREVITLHELPMSNLVTDQPASGEVREKTLRETERLAILEALAGCGDNRRLAAEKLGISKRTLQYRLKEYGLVE